MLIEAEDADFTALIEGEGPRSLRLADSATAPPEVLEMLRGLAASIRTHFTPAAWLIVEDGEIVGLCSIIKPPSADGVVDIGYGVAPSRQGRGVARRAVAAILEWAREDPRVSAVTAEASIANPASRIVLERSGFARTGTRIDEEDGELACWKADTAG